MPRYLIPLLGTALVVIALAGLASRGVADLVELSAARDSLLAEMEELDHRNQGLMAQIGRLKQDPTAYEEFARRELGMAKPSEIVYVFNSTLGAKKASKSSVGPETDPKD